MYVTKVFSKWLLPSVSLDISKMMKIFVTNFVVTAHEINLKTIDVLF